MGNDSSSRPTEQGERWTIWVCPKGHVRAFDYEPDIPIHRCISFECDDNPESHMELVEVVSVRVAERLADALERIEAINTVDEPNAPGEIARAALAEFRSQTDDG